MFFFVFILSFYVLLKLLNKENTFLLIFTRQVSSKIPEYHPLFETKINFFMIIILSIGTCR